MQDKDLEIFSLQEKNKMLNQTLQEVYEELWQIKEVVYNSSVSTDDKRLKWFYESIKQEKLYSQAQEENDKLRSKLGELEKQNRNLEQMVEDLSVKIVKNEIKEVIQKYRPVDFDDVWTIVINKLQKSSEPKKDFDSILQEIKKDNPSLFF